MAVGGLNFSFPKFNQIWCVSYLHEWHMHGRHFFGPRPLGPWGGTKRSNIIKSELQGSRSPNFGAEIRPHSQCQKVCFFPNSRQKIPNLTKKKIYFFFLHLYNTIFFFSIFIIKNILLHIYIEYNNTCFFLSLFSQYTK